MGWLAFAPCGRGRFGWRRVVGAVYPIYGGRGWGCILGRDWLLWVRVDFFGGFGMARKGTGLMIVWADVPGELEEDFNRWYNEEHLAELLAVPGVLSAARYEAVRSGPKHMAVYELESAGVVETEAFLGRPRTEWGRRVSPSVIGTNFMNNVYEMIHPAGVTGEMAGSGMAPALQIGRMDVAAEVEGEWNEWYSGVYVPNYERAPGCIRGRRWRAVRGSPAYATVYEFEDAGVSETAEWLRLRDAHPDNERMRGVMVHAAGSPGIWRKTFEL